jgi:hypothetical protein
MTEILVETHVVQDLPSGASEHSGRSLNPLEHSPTADELADLRTRLQSQLQSGSMSLELLLLEWRYDVALLLDHLRHWMYEIDRDFNR